jgi:hypothetical protein
VREWDVIRWVSRWYNIRVDRKNDSSIRDIGGRAT